MQRVVSASMLFLFFVSCSSRSRPSDPKQELEPVVRTLFSRTTSPKKEDRDEALKTWKEILPTKKDVDFLFPQHAKLLWPRVEKVNKVLTEEIMAICKEESKNGPAQEIKIIDALDARDEGDYSEVLKIIPQDVAVFKFSIKYQNGNSERGGAFLLVKGRTIFFKYFEDIPQVILEAEEDLKKRSR